MEMQQKACSEPGLLIKADGASPGFGRRENVAVAMRDGMFLEACLSRRGCMWTFACQPEPLIICWGREQVGHGRVESTGTDLLSPPSSTRPEVRQREGMEGWRQMGKADGSARTTGSFNQLADVSVFCFWSSGFDNLIIKPAGTEQELIVSFPASWRNSCSCIELLGCKLGLLAWTCTAGSAPVDTMVLTAVIPKSFSNLSLC